MPSASIGVDVITGFPAETDEEFLETFEFIRDLEVSYLHVFTYSERDNTLAAEMSHAVPMSKRKERNKMLRILSEKKSQAFAVAYSGQTFEVLFESENKSGFMFGYTPNYIRVTVPFQESWINQLVSCKLLEIDKLGHMTADPVAVNRNASKVVEHQN
jgi:threonylcarbamoyladenosine tRNA methylthiotransferase MtaB